jgi:hypothetical protein
MAKLGTILPTRESLRLTDYWRDEIDSHKRNIEKTLPGTLSVVGGERRYYTDNDNYAIVSDHFAILHFSRRADGHFYAVR